MSGREDYDWIEGVCPICNVPPARYLGRRGGEAHRQHAGVECAIWQCRRCGLVLPNPMPIPVGGLGQHYELDPETYFEHHDTQLRDQRALALLERIREVSGIPPGGTLLDIGSGRGEVLKAARQTGWSVVGIEPSQRFAEVAARHSGASEILSEPIERCNLAPESFDAVVLQAVLEHLYNPDETIREIARVLKPGGILYADVPNEEGLYTLMGNLYQRLRGRGWVINLSPTFSPFHVYGFGPRSLRALYHKHGMEVAEMTIGGGRTPLPRRRGLFGLLEHVGSGVITRLGNAAGMGTYITSWARKSPRPRDVEYRRSGDSSQVKDSTRLPVGRAVNTHTANGTSGSPPTFEH